VWVFFPFLLKFIIFETAKIITKKMLPFQSCYENWNVSSKERQTALLASQISEYVRICPWIMTKKTGWY